MRSTDSFTKDSSCSSSSTTASMQPANIILKRQKLFPAIDLSQCWKDAQHRADAVNSGLNQVGGHKSIDHGTNSDRERVRPNQSTLYLDTSRYMPSAYGTGVPEALRAEHHVEDDQRNKTPEHWISERAPSTNYSTLHDIGSLENATKPEISLQNTESHCHHKSSYISRSRHSLELELLKRRTGNGLEKQRTSNIHSTMYFPSIESSHHVKTNDNDVRSGKRARVLHSHDCTDDEQESNHSHCRSVNLERGKGRSSMLHVVHARDALFEVPRRSSPFISRLELLEGLFFTPASHAQPVTSSWDTSPGLGEGLRDITLSRVASVTSRYSRDTETPLAYKEGPLVKFRRVVKMVLILLKATFNDRDGGQRRERYLSLWASVLNGKFSSSRRAYEMYGISFDPQEFKANTEVQVSTEAKAILSLEPGQRSQQQLRQALASLRQAVEEFSEFPITMQESLARVGRYEHFEAKRVIIRQGHLAENFYFILSGTAVVIILDTDKLTGEQKARTVTFLGKGKSFGELALMYKSRRTATVRCQEDVELLAVAREDFVDIFMHVERDVEPEHVTFLRSLHVLRDWPVEVLPANNPRVLVFTYVRRGIVLCKDSNCSEWIYVIKSGSCRVIKALKQANAQQKIQKQHRQINKAGKEHTGTYLSPLPVLAPIPSRPQYERRSRVIKRTRLVPGMDLPTERVKEISMDHYCLLDAIYRSRHRLSLSGHATSSQPSSRTISLHSDSGENSPDRPNGDTVSSSTVFVDLLSLLPGDIYGLESCVFRSMGNRTTSTSLVSGGAEVIMINRKFFLDHTSEQLRKRLRREIRPLPSEENLQCQLETKISWEAYRHDTLKQTLELRRKQAQSST